MGPLPLCALLSTHGKGGPITLEVGEHAWVGCTHTHVQVDMDQHVTSTAVVMETNPAT